MGRQIVASRWCRSLLHVNVVHFSISWSGAGFLAQPFPTLCRRREGQGWRRRGCVEAHGSARVIAASKFKQRRSERAWRRDAAASTTSNGACQDADDAACFRPSRVAIENTGTAIDLVNDRRENFRLHSGQRGRYFRREGSSKAELRILDSGQSRHLLRLNLPFLRLSRYYPSRWDPLRATRSFVRIWNNLRKVDSRLPDLAGLSLCRIFLSFPFFPFLFLFFFFLFFFFSKCTLQFVSPESFQLSRS